MENKKSGILKVLGTLGLISLLIYKLSQGYQVLASGSDISVAEFWILVIIVIAQCVMAVELFSLRKEAKMKNKATKEEAKTSIKETETNCKEYADNAITDAIIPIKALVKANAKFNAKMDKRLYDFLKSVAEGKLKP